MELQNERTMSWIMRRVYNTGIFLNPRRIWRDCDAYERQTRQLDQKCHAHLRHSSKTWRKRYVRQAP